MSTPEGQSRYHLRVVLMSALLLGLLKFIFMPLQFSALLQDFCVFLLLLQGLSVLASYSFAKNLFFWLVYPCVFFILALYTLHFELISLAEIAIDLRIGFNIALLQELWEEQISIDYLTISIIVLLLSFLLSAVFSEKLNRILQLLRARLSGAHLCLLLVLSSLLPPQNPFFETNRALLQGLLRYQHESIPPGSTSGKWSVTEVYRERDFTSVTSLPVDNVILLVMETETIRSFERKRSTSENEFRESFIRQSNFYTNFYTQNSASRTSLLAMLSGIFIPHRAYAVRWDQYRRVGTKLELLSLFHRLGFSRVYATSRVDPPLIGRLDDWDHRITQQNYDISGGNHVCLHVLRTEKACEDKSMIDPIVSFLEKNDKNLVIQPFVVNHSKKYIAALKTDSVAYVFSYLEELVRGLRKIGKLDSTAIVLVADHGRRTQRAAMRRDNYRVPLLIWKKGRKGKQVHGFYSNTRFLELLVADLLDAEDSVRHEKRFHVVGPSWLDVVGEIRADGTYVFVDRNTNAIESNVSDTIPAAAMLSALEQYTRAFKAWCLSENSS